MRRFMIAVAALLAALSLSAGPANASANDLELFASADLTGTPQVVTSVTTSCTAASGQVQSASNHFTSKAVALYSSSGCTSGQLAVLFPQASVTGLSPAATHFQQVFALGLFKDINYANDRQIVWLPAPTTCTAVDTNAIPSGEVRSVHNMTGTKDFIFYSSLQNCRDGAPLATVLADSSNPNLGSVATYYKATS